MSAPLNPGLAAATAGRVLRQVRGDSLPFAVWVRTPSRSNRHATIGSGSPSTVRPYPTAWLTGSRVGRIFATQASLVVEWPDWAAT